MSDRYDIAVVGAGAAGLVGAEFAGSVGVKTALIESHRIGGDCTWTGCVPSKALIRAAGVAHTARHAARFGIDLGAPRVDMPRVHAWVASTIRDIYERGTPEKLREKGMDVLIGPTEFLDPNTLRAGERTVVADRFVICTGARPRIPEVPGLDRVPYVTYERLFDMTELPEHLLVLGGGPLGVEQAQAFARLGSAVTMVGPSILPREESDTQAFIADVLQREGVRIVRSRATEVRSRDGAVELEAEDGTTVRGSTLLVSTGRVPNVDGLALNRAGVRQSARGIEVNRFLQTSVDHIYACGDVIGGPQFSHLAGWQCFQAVRNALFPGRTAALPESLPMVTFTDPEVARVGLLEKDAREKHGAEVSVHTWPLSRSDRAVCDGETHGYIRFITRRDKELLGATVIGARAGEMIDELAVAITRGITIDNLAGVIHAYPTWTIAIQQFAASILMKRFGGSRTADLLRRVARLTD